MAKTLAALALALLLLASPALAWNEPENFRGIPWGATMDQAQETLLKTWPAGVTPPDCSRETGVCGHPGKLGPIDVTFIYSFKEDRFAFAQVRFKTIDYDTVRRVFEERYGTPTLRQSDQIWWKGENASVLLRRVGSRAMEGSALIALKSAVDKNTAERDKAIKKGKDDL
jgi:hypothetical protein